MVEIHGFKDENNKWIVKELAVIGYMFTFHTVFKSPYTKDYITHRRTRQSIDWLERNYHKIQWEDGVTPFKGELIKRLLHSFDVVYTKGLEKKRFLDQYHYDVREIEDNAVDKSYYMTCCLPQHNFDTKCALQSANMYYDFLQKKCIVSL